MKTLLTIAAMLVAVLALAGCRYELRPLSEGTVSIYSKDSPGLARKLSAEQLHGISEWFGKHKSGWSASYATYVPNVEIRLTHVDGGLSVVNVLKAKVIVYGKGSQVEQEFMPSEITVLLSVFGQNDV